jgi:hypothetical protein
MDNGAPLVSPIANFALYSGQSNPSFARLPQSVPLVDSTTAPYPGNADYESPDCAGSTGPFCLTLSADLEF